jgi:hypothetical protein
MCAERKQQAGQGEQHEQDWAAHAVLQGTAEVYATAAPAGSARRP